ARNDLERLDALPVYGVETSVDLGNPERLYGVVGAVMLGDEIAVANAGNHEVLTFGGGWQTAPVVGQERRRPGRVPPPDVDRRHRRRLDLHVRQRPRP